MTGTDAVYDRADHDDTGVAPWRRPALRRDGTRAVAWPHRRYLM